MWIPEKAIHRIPVLLFVIDVCVVGLGFYCAYEARFSGPFLDPRSAGHSADHRVLGIVAMGFWPAALHLFNLYNPSRFRHGFKLFVRVAQSGVLTAILSATVIFALNATQVSRLVFTGMFAVSVVALWGCRFGLSRLLAQVTSDLRIVVVGTGAVASSFVQAMRKQGETDSRVLGFFDVGEPVRAVEDSQIIGPVHTLTHTLEHEVVDRVVLAVPQENISELEDAFACCRDLGIDVVMVPDYVSSLMVHAVPGSLFGVPVLRLDMAPQLRAVMAGKRLFDIIVAAILLTLCAPLLVCVCVAIRATSTGSPLFVQRRLGLNGRVFSLYKLRTMWQGAHLRQHELSHPKRGDRARV